MKSKKVKWLSQEALQIAEERKAAKSKGGRERYSQLNAEFQRIARRDKKDFFNEQCIKIEENNRRGKSRSLFRKTGNIKGTFHPKMCTVADKNSRDLVEVEEIKKKWKENMEELHEKDLNELDNRKGVVSHQSQTFCSVKSSGS